MHVSLQETGQAYSITFELPKAPAHVFPKRILTTFETYIRYKIARNLMTARSVLVHNRGLLQSAPPSLGMEISKSTHKHLITKLGKAAMSLDQIAVKHSLRCPGDDSIMGYILPLRSNEKTLRADVLNIVHEWKNRRSMPHAHRESPLDILRWYDKATKGYRPDW